MDLGKSFSRRFKKVKNRLTGGNRKRSERSGSKDGREQRSPRGSDVEGSEASRRNSHQRSEVEDAAKSGSNRKGDDVDGKKVGRVDPPTSTSSTQRGGESDSMQTICYFSCHLSPLLQGTWTLLFLNMCKRLLLPTTTTRTLQTRTSSTSGSPLHLPQPNYSSVGEQRQISKR